MAPDTPAPADEIQAPAEEPIQLNRAQRRKAAKQRRTEGKDPQRTAAPGTDVDPDSPDSESPGTLVSTAFDLASLVNTIKGHFRVKEETALKTVDLALSWVLTNLTMKQQQQNPFAGLVKPQPAPTDEPQQE